MAETTVEKTAPPEPGPATGPWRSRTGARRSTRTLRLYASAALTGLTVLAVLVVPPLVQLDQQAVDLAAKLRPPGADHPFGTDDVGRDLLLRCVYGLRVSLLVGVAAALKSESGKVGFVGGVETPLIQKFQAGFEAGVTDTKADATVESKYITVPPDFTGFNAPDKGETIAKGLAEGLAFALHAGLDAKRVVDVISKGAATSWQMENRGKTMVDGQFDFGFAVNLMRKDLRIAMEEARSNGAQLPAIALIDQFYARVQQQGGGKLDTSSLIKLLVKP